MVSAGFIIQVSEFSFDTFKDDYKLQAENLILNLKDIFLGLLVFILNLFCGS